MIPEPKWLTFLLYLIEDESRHFTCSAFSGFSGFFLTLIMLCVAYLVYLYLTRRKASIVAGFFILICSILVGLAFSAASHYFLDYAHIWYETPLGPALWGGGMHPGLDLVMP